MQCPKKRVTLPHDKHTYENIWTPCQIVDYDENKRVFQIIWYDNNNNNKGQNNNNNNNNKGQNNNSNNRRSKYEEKKNEQITSTTQQQLLPTNNKKFVGRLNLCIFPHDNTQCDDYILCFQCYHQCYH